MDKNIEQKVRLLAGRVAENCGYELIDINLRGSGRAILRVMIDKEGGITLEDCEIFSRRLGAVLDVEGPMAGSYTLEVSSPGLDRPLSRLKDFERSVGKLARIITLEKINNRNFFLGRIEKVGDNLIRLSLSEDREVIDIPYSAISKARLEIELK